MRVYVEVSKNHNIAITDVIKGKFKPEINLLIRYYNHQFNLERREYERIEKENKKMKENTDYNSYKK